MPRIRDSAAVRDQAVRLVLESQKPLTHVAEKFGCSVSTLQNWLRDHRQEVKGDKPDAKNSNMLTIPTDTRISLCTSPVDMRKSFNGLIGVVRNQLGDDPYFIRFSAVQDDTDSMSTHTSSISSTDSAT